MTIPGNAVEHIAANGTTTAQTGPSGQVYAGTVNGVTDDPTMTTRDL